jgi:hypothetical protein
VTLEIEVAEVDLWLAFATVRVRRPRGVGGVLFGAAPRCGFDGTLDLARCMRQKRTSGRLQVSRRRRTGPSMPITVRAHMSMMASIPSGLSQLNGLVAFDCARGSGLRPYWGHGDRRAA